ncbi:twin-arginine translocation signal domain-containing protein [Natronolimnohabitans innermongolicus]|uniref:Envelope protein N-terminal domain-containing protein n=1 Tax=Natronolimnohabitans innermongolicus JCM 12255 TaxID=1227499 RepID=L9WSQ3_9EURY|nr:twin-arginine translocation signal domain-containing protein [Natronolimnohabitans innermongolicus]ELY52475.1 hypothetical protein C493_15540 [Natronolimnohabitans innermongolicus JCM 12255]
MSADSPQPTAHEVEPGCSLDRRGFLQASAATGAAIATAGAGTIGATDRAAALSARQLSPAAMLYDTVDSLFSSGYSEEDVDEITRSNLHWSIYQSLESVESLQHGFLSETNDWVEPSSPSNGSLARTVWGEIRAEAFRQIDNGAPVNDVRSASIDVALDYLAGREKNYIRQGNEYIFDLLRHFSNFIDMDEISDDWSSIDPEGDPSDGPNHVDGETAGSGFSSTDFSETADGLEAEDVFAIEGDFEQRSCVALC